MGLGSKSVYEVYEVACLSSLTAMWSDSITCIQDALSAEFQQPESLEPSQTSEGAEASSFYKHYSRASAHQQNQEPHMDLQPMNLCLRSSQWHDGWEKQNIHQEQLNSIFQILPQRNDPSITVTVPTSLPCSQLASSHTEQSLHCKTQSPDHSKDDPMTSELLSFWEA